MLKDLGTVPEDSQRQRLPPGGSLGFLQLLRSYPTKVCLHVGRMYGSRPNRNKQVMFLKFLESLDCTAI